MNALQSSLKQLTALFDTAGKAKKALNRARQECESAQQEVNRLALMLHAATVPDPVLHTTRIQATPADLKAWRERHDAARAALDAATAQVERLEAEQQQREQDLAGQLTLPAVQEAHAQAREELRAAERTVTDLSAKISRAESALAGHLAELERLREAVAAPDSDAAAQVPALEAQREKVSSAELLVEVLKDQRGRGRVKVKEAQAVLANWERQFWGKVADDAFAPGEIAGMRQRLVRSYAARLMSGDVHATLWGYTARLMELDGNPKQEIAGAQAALRIKYGIQ